MHALNVYLLYILINLYAAVCLVLVNIIPIPVPKVTPSNISEEFKFISRIYSKTKIITSSRYVVVVGMYEQYLALVL